MIGSHVNLEEKEGGKSGLGENEWSCKTLFFAMSVRCQKAIFELLCANCGGSWKRPNGCEESCTKAMSNGILLCTRD